MKVATGIRDGGRAVAVVSSHTPRCGSADAPDAAAARYIGTYDTAYVYDTRVHTRAHACKPGH